MKLGSKLVLLAAAALGACGAPAPATSARAPAVNDVDGPAAPHVSEARPAAAPDDPVERALDEVALVHGAPGPWAVAGYRMSAYALTKLGLPRGSFDLEIVHTTPPEVQFSCIADGAAAHSGASLGKLNLSLSTGEPDEVVTVFRHKKTGETVALRPSKVFRARYTNAPRAHARALGREIMTLPEAEVFEEVR
jgi:formylmethanofuran dehydrogenase subunit E